MTHLHRCYGTTIASAVELPALLGADGDEAEVTHRVGDQGVRPRGREIYRSGAVHEDGTPLLVASRDDSTVWFDYAVDAVFAVEGCDVVTHPYPEVDVGVWARWFAGPVLATVLEREHGRSMLHAGAVVRDGAAIAFVGTNTAGKSTLVASLVADGVPLLCDDVLAVDVIGSHVVAHPAYPSMRMWPSTAAQHFGSSDDLPRVHPDTSKVRVPVGAGWGSFCRDAVPLAAIVVLDRQGPEASLSVEPIAGAAATMELVQHTFATRILTALGHQTERFSRISALAGAVPMYRLTYPTGLDRLAEAQAYCMDAVLRP